MIRRPPRSTQSRSSAASDVYKRQGIYGPRLARFGKAPDGKDAFLNTYSDTLGVQVARSRGTNLVFYGVWQSDWNNDIRNAEHNIKRNFYYENPESEYHGEKIDLSEFPAG